MENEVIILGELVITPLIKAQKTFVQALGQVNSELERDGAIKRFEYTYELVWKILKKILKFKGLEVHNPRDVFREAARQKIIDDPAIWFTFMKQRGLTAHNYSQDCADEIFSCFPQFEKELDKVIQVIKKL